MSVPCIYVETKRGYLRNELSFKITAKLRKKIDSRW